MKITEVNVIPIKPRDGLIGFANLVVDNYIWLNSIAIYLSPNKTYRLLYPTKIAGSKSLNVFHPINRIASNEIEQAIFKKCKDIFERSNNDRYSQTQHHAVDALKIEDTF